MTSKTLSIHDQKLIDASFHLGPNDLKILRHLKTEDTFNRTVSGISSGTSISSEAISMILPSLEGRGLIELVPPPSDGPGTAHIPKFATINEDGERVLEMLMERKSLQRA